MCFQRAREQAGHDGGGGDGPSDLGDEEDEATTEGRRSYQAHGKRDLAPLDGFLSDSVVFGFGGLDWTTYRRIEEAAADPKEDPDVDGEGEAKGQTDVKQLGGIGAGRIVRIWRRHRRRGDLSGREGKEEEQKRSRELADHGDDVISNPVGQPMGVASQPPFTSHPGPDDEKPSSFTIRPRMGRMGITMVEDDVVDIVSTSPPAPATHRRLDEP